MYSAVYDAGWWRPIGCLKLQVIPAKKATEYSALFRKMTCKDKAFYGSWPPYPVQLLGIEIIMPWVILGEYQHRVRGSLQSSWQSIVCCWCSAFAADAMSDTQWVSTQSSWLITEFVTINSLLVMLGVCCWCYEWYSVSINTEFVAHYRVRDSQ